MAVFITPEDKDMTMKRIQFEHCPLIFTVDPCNMYPSDVPTDRFIEACGLIIPWLIEAPADESLMETFNREYMFGPMEMGGEIREDGSYSYPDDPTLYPLVTTTKGGEVFYMYQHAIVGVVSVEDLAIQSIVRMD